MHDANDGYTYTLHHATSNTTVSYVVSFSCLSLSSFSRLLNSQSGSNLLLGFVVLQ